MICVSAAPCYKCEAIRRPFQRIQGWDLEVYEVEIKTMSDRGLNSSGERKKLGDFFNFLIEKVGWFLSIRPSFGGQNYLVFESIWGCYTQWDSLVAPKSWLCRCASKRAVGEITWIELDHYKKRKKENRTFVVGINMIKMLVLLNC